MQGEISASSTCPFFKEESKRWHKCCLMLGLSQLIFNLDITGPRNM